jgi:HAD superfamily hydrolase (TIGR01509 family)
MNWIHRYQLFLFDFDGLLVNTEMLHFRAYQNMCEKRGFKIQWSFEQYSEFAHHHATGLRDAIYAEFPTLQKQEPDWTILYEEKKKAFLDLLKEGAAQLMPGVHNLLQKLAEANIKRCVVTHSASPLIKTIRQQNPILNSIPYWITREDYYHPKPNPECYLTAIDRHSQEGDRIIGFEDSPRGLNALLQTKAKAVLICPTNSAYLDRVLTSDLSYYPSFTAINENNYP